MNNADILASLPIEQLKAVAKRVFNDPASPSRQTIRRQSRAANGFPLSFAQERLWIVNQIDPQTSAYNLCFTLRYDTPLAPGLLQKALNEIVRRHEVLRTRFSVVDGQPMQIISEQLMLALEEIDISHLPEEEQEAKAHALVAEEGRKPFDLATGPLVRATLVRMRGENQLLVLTLHHIVFDGSSAHVLSRDLESACEALRNEAEVALPELPIQYADYSVWQREWLQGDRLERLTTYWKTQLEGLGELELPLDHPRPAVNSFRGARRSVMFSSDLTEAVKSLAQRQSVTPFMVMLAAFKALLYRYAGQSDIVVGIPIANRTSMEVEGLIGYFVNSLVLRTRADSDMPYIELLDRVREVAKGAYAHQELPFEMVVEELNPPRAMGRNPLFQVMFNYNNTESPFAMQDEDDAGKPVGSGLQSTGNAAFDLTLTIDPINPLTMNTDEFNVVLEYNLDLFDEATINRMLEHYRRVVATVTTDPQVRIADIDLVSEAERNELLVRWNDTRARYPADRTVHELFEIHAELAPDAVAVVSEDERLSYRELNMRANRLAHHLRQQGVGPEVLVGVCLARSVEVVVAVLAVLKAGGAYVPLDSSNPKQRLAFILEETHADVLITHSRLAREIAPRTARVVCVDTDHNVINTQSADNPRSGATAENLAYVMYTSGSTGGPKGVFVSHRGLLNLVYWHQRTFEVTASDRSTQLASMSFDASVWELWPYLSAGATVYIVDDEKRTSAEELHEWLITRGITISFLPTPLAESVLRSEWPESVPLRAMLTGGDRLNQFAPKGLPFKLINNYGPTEITVVATYGVVSNESDGCAAPPIGRPIANTQVYILDTDLNVVPAGIAGELHISGDSLARGYLNRQELTAEKFIPHPFSDEPGARLYRTGDRVRYRAGANIEFLGRVDRQVKMRGFRIEPGEIEVVLKAHESLTDAAVVLRGEREEKRLVAYVVASGKNFKVSELKSYLRKRLPEYMVPTAIVVLEALPLTSSGKVDQRALPDLQDYRATSEESYEAPRTETERMIAEVWQSVLRLDKVGIHDNFFDLGGNSLSMVQVATKLRVVLSKQISMMALFKGPTIASLANVLSGTTRRDELVESTARAETRREAARRRQGVGRRRNLVTQVPN